tara:strand:- start:482 stop:655 length:174 start_codon:yes stop_codon:yes gene_type:complete
MRGKISYDVDNMSSEAKHSLAYYLKLMWTKYELGEIDQDELTEKLERLLYWTGVMQE